MKKIAYNEYWEETNVGNEFPYDEIDGDEYFDLSIIPEYFDFDAFSDKQLYYLSGFMEGYRKEKISEVLQFILKPITEVDITEIKERSKENRKSRVLCRLALLYKLLNCDDDIPWAEIPERFLLSNHTFYDERKAVIEELKPNAKNSFHLISNNAKHTRPDSKPKSR